MAEINKSEIIDALIKKLGLSTAKDKIPKEIASKIVPTFNIVPEYQGVLRGVRELTSADGYTLYTIPSGYEFYLCSCWVSIQDSPTNNSDMAYIGVYTAERPNTQEYPIVTMGGLGAGTDESNSNSNSITFNPPLKLKDGSSINLDCGAYGVGSVKYGGGIYGYLVPKY